MNRSARHLTVVISAPSGTGKNTLIDALMREDGALRYSVSCTTRPPRDGEVDGVHYHFLSRDAFEREVAAGRFLEYATVYNHYYGTRADTVRNILANGHDVLMDVDVQGAASIRNFVATRPGDDPIRRGFVDIFIQPPSLAELRRRIESRGTDHPEVIARRMDEAEKEMACRGAYRHVVVNDRFEQALSELRAILTAERNSLEDSLPS